MRSIVKAVNLNKYYDQYHALRDINIEVEQGEVMCIIGPSGSGKSTLLRCVNQLEKIDKGGLWVDGELVGYRVVGNKLHEMNESQIARQRLATGMVFQRFNLFPHMTVLQNIIEGPCQVLKRSPKEAIEDALELLARVGLADKRNAYPVELSGGQQQRVALARSLAKGPKLLLLDEPMGALDKKLRSQMQLELVEIIERVGVTCVMVTHDQEEAMTMAERIAIMHLGWIAQVGSPMDIYETPASRLVCEFIGSVNVFDGELTDDGADHAIIQSPQLERPIYIGHGISTRAQEKQVTFALRPEKLLMGTSLPADHEHPDYNWCSGTVQDIAYLGGHSVYYVRLASGHLVQCFIANAERLGKRPTWDDAVVVYWEDDSGVVLQA